MYGRLDDTVTHTARRTVVCVGIYKVTPTATHNPFGRAWEEKRKMLEIAFDGLTPEGGPMGCYIESIPGKERTRPRPWAYSLRGTFAIDEGGNTATNPDSHFDEFSKELQPC